MFATVQGPGRALRGDCQEPRMGRDGTMQFTPVLQTSGQRALQGKTFKCGGLQGTAGDYGGLWGTTGDYESYQQHFMTHFASNTEIHLIRLKET